MDESKDNKYRVLKITVIACFVVIFIVWIFITSKQFGKLLNLNYGQLDVSVDSVVEQWEDSNETFESTGFKKGSDAALEDNDFDFKDEIIKMYAMEAVTEQMVEEINKNENIISE